MSNNSNEDLVLTYARACKDCDYNTVEKLLNNKIFDPTYKNHLGLRLAHNEGCYEIVNLIKNFYKRRGIKVPDLDNLNEDAELSPTNVNQAYNSNSSTTYIEGYIGDDFFNKDEQGKGQGKVYKQYSETIREDDENLNELNIGDRSYQTAEPSTYGREEAPMSEENKSGIHIKPSHEGLFTAKAKRAGKSVQAYASHVLANKDKFDSKTVKQANFAKNAKKFKHEEFRSSLNLKTLMLAEAYGRIRYRDIGRLLLREFEDKVIPIEELNDNDLSEIVQFLSKNFDIKLDNNWSVEHKSVRSEDIESGEKGGETKKIERSSVLYKNNNIVVILANHKPYWVKLPQDKLLVDSEVDATQSKTFTTSSGKSVLIYEL